MPSRRSFLAGAALLAAGMPVAARARGLPPGSEMLTEQEREAFRRRIRDADSERERERIQDEYRELIRSRAQRRDQQGGGGEPGPQQTPRPPAGGKKRRQSLYRFRRAVTIS